MRFTILYEIYEKVGYKSLIPPYNTTEVPPFAENFCCYLKHDHAVNTAIYTICTSIIGAAINLLRSTNK